MGKMLSKDTALSLEDLQIERLQAMQRVLRYNLRDRRETGKRMKHVLALATQCLMINEVLEHHYDAVRQHYENDRPSGCF